MNFYGITVYVAPNGSISRVDSLPRASEEEALKEAQKGLSKAPVGSKAVLCRYVLGSCGGHLPAITLTRLEKSIKKENVK
jgi:hypothetical protein